MVVLMRLLLLLELQDIIVKQSYKERLKGIQNKLLVLGGFLASDAKGKEIMKDQIKEDDIKLLEEYI